MIHYRECEVIKTYKNGEVYKRRFTNTSTLIRIIEEGVLFCGLLSVVVIDVDTGAIIWEEYKEA